MTTAVYGVTACVLKLVKYSPVVISLMGAKVDGNSIEFTIYGARFAVRVDGETFTVTAANTFAKYLFVVNGYGRFQQLTSVEGLTDTFRNLILSIQKHDLERKTFAQLNDQSATLYTTIDAENQIVVFNRNNHNNRVVVNFLDPSNYGGSVFEIVFGRGQNDQVGCRDLDGFFVELNERLGC